MSRDVAHRADEWISSCVDQYLEDQFIDGEVIEGDDGLFDVFYRGRLIHDGVESEAEAERGLKEYHEEVSR